MFSALPERIVISNLPNHIENNIRVVTEIRTQI